MIEPTWPWLFPGLFLLVASPAQIFLVSFNLIYLRAGDWVVAAGLFVGSMLILRKERRGAWVVLAAMAVNLALAVWNGSEWLAISAVLQAVLFGAVALIPVIFGLKPGQHGRY